MPNDLSDAIEHLSRSIVSLREEVIEANRRIANMMRPGKIKEVDPEKGLVKVSWSKDAEGQEVISPWIPWTQRAGSQKEWNPPAVDEQVRIMSPSGDISDQSWVDVGGFSDKNPANHNKKGEYKLNIGKFVEIFSDGNKLVLKAKQIVIEGEHIQQKGNRIDHDQGANVPQAGTGSALET